MTMFVSFCAALAAALIAVNVAQTWAAYPQLPDRVALQLDWNGATRSYGPRATIWLTVIIQTFVGIAMAFTGYSMANHAPGVHGSLTGFAIFSVLFNALLWRVQALLLFAAKSAPSRVPMNGFWLFVAAWTAFTVIDAFAIR